MLGLGTDIISSSYVSMDLKDATTDLELWLKNDTGVAVGQWDDSSGNDNHARQTTAENQAVVSGGGLDFTPGESDHYDLTSAITIAKNGGFCVAVVIDQETISNNTILSKDDDDQIQIVNNGRFRLRANDDEDTTTNFDVNGTPFDGNKMLLLLNRSAGASNRFTMFKNGTQLTFNTDTSTNEAEGENPNGFDINVLGSKGGTGQFFDGVIFELAFWSKGLSSQEITDVNDYLKSVHGL